MRAQAGSRYPGKVESARQRLTAAASLCFIALLAMSVAAVGAYGGQASAKSRAAARNSSRAVPLDARQCRALKENEKPWVDPGWGDLARFAIICPLESSRGTPVLYVLSVDGDRVVQSPGQGPIAPKVPEAVILTPDGVTVGTLPFAFPFDPPVNLYVTFTGWSGDFPHTIELYVEDPAVSGNRKLSPLRWDPARKRFEETPTAPVK